MSVRLRLLLQKKRKKEIHCSSWENLPAFHKKKGFLSDMRRSGMLFFFLHNCSNNFAAIKVFVNPLLTDD